MTGSAPVIPLALRVHLAHAVVQAVADEATVDILHIKGPAAAAVRGLDRPSVDADVLVRPSHLKRLAAALRRSGWERVTDLYSGGLVEHSANWYHPQVGQLDLHVRFPGIMIDPADAFDHLWVARETVEIAHRPVSVPSASAHRLIVLIHAARNPGARTPEIAATWHALNDTERAAVSAESVALRAGTALAASLGVFAPNETARDAAMWRLYAEDISSAPTLRRVLSHAKASPTRRLIHVRTLGAIFYLVMSKPRRMAVELGRAATPIEVIKGYRDMVVAGVLGRRRRRGGPPSPSEG